MTARARSRPRTARSSRARTRGRSRFSLQRLTRREWLAIAGAAILIGALLLLIDAGRLAADVRDWLLQRLGLGLFIVIGWLAFAAIACARHSYERAPGRFARHAGGILALGLFAWGTLALNEADWQVGAVDFSRATLGGDFGHWLIAGF